MEGLEGGAGDDALDSDIIITNPEDGGGGAWDKFAWGVWVGMIRNHRKYRAKWGGSKKAASGQVSEAHGVGEGGEGVVAITQPRFYGGLHQG